MSSCTTQYTCPTYMDNGDKEMDKTLVYSDYESMGGFNYLEDAVEVFDSLKINKN